MTTKGTVIRVNNNKMWAVVEVYEPKKNGGCYIREYRIPMVEPDEFEYPEKLEVELRD